MKKYVLLSLICCATTYSRIFDDIDKGSNEVKKRIGKHDKAIIEIGESFKPNSTYVQYKSAGVKDKNSFDVLAYNVYLRPRAFSKNGQDIRVRQDMIPKAIGRNYDAIIFSEAFDNTARADLISNMKKVGYKYATPVVGKNRKNLTNGGVMIMSRYPIEKFKKKRFESVCVGSDCQIDKGWVYARIDKNGRKYHVIGTHTQVSPEVQNAKVRNKQFDLIVQFIKDRNIPKSEAVIIGGDLNVDKLKYPTQYKEMLRRLHAGQPRIISKRGNYTGSTATFDPKLNNLADRKSDRAYLNYVLYSKDHAVPLSSFNMPVPMQAPQLWREYAHESYNNAISDHFPVHGNMTWAK